MQFSIKKSLYAVCPPLLRPIWDRIESSPLGYRLAKAAFWTLTGEGLARGLRLLAIIIVARILGQTVFGEFGMIRSTVTMFGLYAGFGMASTATKHIAEFRLKNPETAGSIIAYTNTLALLFSLSIGVFVTISAPWLATHFLHAPHLTSVLQIAAIALIFSGLSSTQTGVLMGFESFKQIASRNIVAALVAFPMLICGAYLWGLMGAVVAFALNVIFLWFISWLAVRKVTENASISVNFKGFSQHLKIFWTYSLPAVLSGTVVVPVLWYARTTLTSQEGGYAELGAFEAAYAWLLIVNYISSKVSTSSFPILAQMYGDGNRDQFSKILKVQFLFNGSITLFFAIIISLLSRIIMSFYGEGFAQQNLVLVILSFTGVLMQLSGIMGLVNKSIGNIWYGAMLNGLWACMLIAGCNFFSDYGAVGLSIAFLMAYTGHFIFTMIYVGLVYKFSPKLKKIVKSFDLSD